MVSSIRRFSSVAPVVLAGLLTLSGCASKKYVRQQVATLDPQIKAVQDKSTENAERIDAVDKRAQTGIATASAAAATADQKAVTAQQSAQTAQTAAQAAQQTANTANNGVQQANNRINTVEQRVASINDIYTQTETQTVLFENNKTNLTDEAKSTLDRIASSVTGQRNGYMLELQGYTDARGTDQFNIGLSQRRAEAVQRYLVSKDVPLYRISLVGLGKDKPVADNKTRQGRDQNRRVEIRVLRSNSNRQTN
jgi:outer membrane protein OmpA-like peptidoglycan-associated protein